MSVNGEFVDYATLDEWRDREHAKDAEIARLRTVAFHLKKHVEDDYYCCSGRDLDGQQSCGCQGITIKEWADIQLEQRND